MKRERDTHRETETERQRERERDRDRETQRESERQRERQTERERQRQRERETEREGNNHNKIFSDLQFVFKGVHRVVIGLLFLLAQEKAPLVQEDVALHGFEPQVLEELSLVLRPHVEGSVHQKATQV